MKNLYDKCSKYALIILFGLFIITLYILLLLRSQDNDMFFEIMSGRDILNGNFHTVSHLNNFPTVIQQWLYAVCMTITDQLGTIGNILFVLIQNIILFVLSYKFIYIKTKNKKLAIVSSIVAIIYCHEYMINIRPQIITVICLVSQLIFLELYKEKKSIKYLLPIFPILILSANMHQAVFLYHMLIMIPYIIQLKKPYIDWKLVIFIPLFLICSLITPYGLDGSLYIVRTFISNSFKYVNIQEINSLNIISLIGIKLLILVVITTILIYLHKSNQYTNFYVYILFILSLINARHVSIMYIAVLFIICTIKNFDKLKNNIVYIIGIILCMILCLRIYNTNNIRSNYGSIADSIKNKNALIYNSDIDVGGWLEYNDCTKVKFDSRIEAFSEEISGVSNIIKEFIAISQGYCINSQQILVEDNEILDILNTYEYVVSNPNQYVNRVLSKSNEWNLIYNDNKYLVYQHNNDIKK